MTSTTTYPVHEVFHTFQGEGIHLGKAAFFIRLHGCPLHCPWCDSAGTWHKDYKPEGLARLDASTLALMAVETKADIVVVTGGEPCIHNLHDLTTELRVRGLRCHLETSGAFPISGAWDWITVSPKDLTVGGHSMQPGAMAVADEFKIIVDTPAVPEQWAFKFKENEALRASRPFKNGNVWLHPEWSQREVPDILGAIGEAVKAHPRLFRAGWQMHKPYRIDFRDNRSRLPVPLGGDLKKGF